MEKRAEFSKKIDARDYIAKSAREESEKLKKLTKVFDEWGKQLCDIPKEELDKIYEEKERQYYCSEPTTILNFTRETLTKYAKKDTEGR